MWFRDIALALKAEYGKNYKIKSGELKYCTIKIASIFDSSVKLILPMWNKTLLLENLRSRRVLGIEYKNPNETVVAMAESMIDSGLIKDKRKKK